VERRASELDEMGGVRIRDWAGVKIVECRARRSP
jgi:hypothetical protein